MLGIGFPHLRQFYKKNCVYISMQYTPFKESPSLMNVKSHKRSLVINYSCFLLSYIFLWSVFFFKKLPFCKYLFFKRNTLLKTPRNVRNIQRKPWKMKMKNLTFNVEYWFFLTSVYIWFVHDDVLITSDIFTNSH